MSQQIATTTILNNNSMSDNMEIGFNKTSQDFDNNDISIQDELEKDEDYLLGQDDTNSFEHIKELTTALSKQGRKKSTPKKTPTKKATKSPKKEVELSDNEALENAENVTNLLKSSEKPKKSYARVAKKDLPIFPINLSRNYSDLIEFLLNYPNITDVMKNYIMVFKKIINDKLYSTDEMTKLIPQLVQFYKLNVYSIILKKTTANGVSGDIEVITNMIRGLCLENRTLLAEEFNLMLIKKISESGYNCIEEKSLDNLKVFNIFSRPIMINNLKEVIKDPHIIIADIYCSWILMLLNCILINDIQVESDEHLKSLKSLKEKTTLLNTDANSFVKPTINVLKKINKTSKVDKQQVINEKYSQKDISNLTFDKNDENEDDDEDDVEESSLANELNKAHLTNTPIITYNSNNINDSDDDDIQIHDD